MVSSALKCTIGSANISRSLPSVDVEWHLDTLRYFDSFVETSLYYVIKGQFRQLVVSSALKCTIGSSIQIAGCKISLKKVLPHRNFWIVMAF